MADLSLHRVIKGYKCQKLFHKCIHRKKKNLKKKKMVAQMGFSPKPSMFS